MTGDSLLAEMERAAHRVRRRHFDLLKSLGVPWIAIGQIGERHHSIGLATIADVGDGLFRPCSDGFGACIVAVCDPFPELGDAGIYDLVAFRSDNPSRWWCRTGLAFALGEHLLELPDPVKVVRTPCDWLSLAGDAVCILDWSERSPAWSDLRSGPSLRFSDDALRQQVCNALVRAAPMPRMETLDAA